MKVAFVGSRLSWGDWEVLEDRGVDGAFFDISDLVESLHIDLTPGAGAHVTLTGSDCLVNAKKVWYHPGQFDTLCERLIPDDSPRRFLARQLAVALKYLEYWLASNCTCVDAPCVQRHWSNKILQQTCLAEKLPHHLLPGIISAADEHISIGSVLKHLSESRTVSERESFYCRLVDVDIRRRLTKGRQHVPMLYQQYADADCEYRTFVVSGGNSTVRIDRKHRNERDIDLHLDPQALAAAEPVSTPPALDVAAISEAFGLNVFAVDYTMLDGMAKIFEVNPLFSWRWMPDPALLEFAGVVRDDLLRVRERSDTQR